MIEIELQQNFKSQKSYEENRKLLKLFRFGYSFFTLECLEFNQLNLEATVVTDTDLVSIKCHKYGFFSYIGVHFRRFNYKNIKFLAFTVLFWFYYL